VQLWIGGLILECLIQYVDPVQRPAVYKLYARSTLFQTLNATKEPARVCGSSRNLSIVEVRCLPTDPWVWATSVRGNTPRVLHTGQLTDC